MAEKRTSRQSSYDPGPGRSRLYDERTADLVLLTYERELTRGLDITEVIKKFGLSEERRVPVID